MNMKIFRIGRAEDNDYVVGHPAVSGYHADLYVYDNGAIQYMDHSTNGTMINGALIHNSTCALTRNDIIVLPGEISIPVADFLVPETQPEATREENVKMPVEAPSPKKEQQSVNGVKPAMKFGETLGYFFKHYTDFDGRARRKEYFFMVLWNLIFMIIPVINILWVLATLIPSLALEVRRLHDVGRSGAWLLLLFVPMVGAIVILVWLLTDSERSANKYGPSPKYE